MARVTPAQLQVLAPEDDAPAKARGSCGRKLPSPIRLDAGEQELLDQVMQYYHEMLLASPEALAYLERRGIGSRELIEAHRLGFANRTLGLRLPAARVKAGAAVRGRLQKVGLLRASGHEHFNGCLVEFRMDYRSFPRIKRGARSTVHRTGPIAGA